MRRGCYVSRRSDWHLPRNPIETDSVSPSTPLAPIGERGAGAAQDPPASGRALTIEPRRGFAWSELLEYRELLFFLIWRDVKVRYKQTALGVAWAVLQPLFGMVVFTFIFGKFAKIPSQGLPYAVFVFTGLLPWTFFSTGVTQSGQSLVNQEHLLTKVYFPRILVPAASFGPPLVDLIVSFVVLAAVMAVYHVTPSWGALLVPALIALTLAAGLGVGVLFAALTVAYRDFRFVVPFTMQIWMFLSPVVYPVTLLPEKYRWALALNPMVGIIDAFRASLLGTPWHLESLAMSTCVTALLLSVGLWQFKRTERRLADIV